MRSAEAAAGELRGNRRARGRLPRRRQELQRRLVAIEPATPRGQPGSGCSALELAKIASDANVSKLVLTHLIPAPPNVIAARMFKSGMGQHYSGPIIVAEDRMMLSW